MLQISKGPPSRPRLHLIPSRLAYHVLGKELMKKLKYSRETKEEQKRGGDHRGLPKKQKLVCHED